MGASSSTAVQSTEQQEEESLALSTGSLQFLRTAFSKLSSPNSTIPVSSLQEVLSLNTSNFKSESELLQIPDKFPELISHLGSSIVSLFFNPTKDSELTWIDFLKGYNKCCAPSPSSQSLITLHLLYFKIHEKLNSNLNLNFEMDEDENGFRKVNGSLNTTELLEFLWMCWILMMGARISRRKDVLVILPDVSHLMKCFGEETESGIGIQDLNGWILSTGFGVARSLTQFVSQKIRTFSLSSSPEENIEEDTENNKYLLTRGRAWAVSLSIRTNNLIDQFLNDSLSGMDINNLLYRSSVNGRGLTRFYDNIEGYNGPVFLLISGVSPNETSINDNNIGNKWIIGVLTEQGFENKDTYFGNSAYLFSIDPIFHSFSPSGKERNFVYCHVRPTIKVYERNPKIVGLGFGGTIGNERIFLDDDFNKVIIRHHAVDKTYQPGSLIPNQGFLAIEGSIIEVEAWGLGGERAKGQQDLLKKRENLFSEQRRTVDLKTFGNWEDSPEKMMMDMVSDPNKARREDR